MSNRAAAILAVAAVISSLCIYATFAQDEVSERPTSGAIVVGAPPIRLQQELPGRYQLSAVTSSSGTVEIVVLDTHTGQCWFRRERTKGWSTWGWPVNQE